MRNKDYQQLQPPVALLIAFAVMLLLLLDSNSRLVKRCLQWLHSLCRLLHSGV
jgi:hypothetical protein